MLSRMTRAGLMMLAVAVPIVAVDQAEIAAQFRGDWVLQNAVCVSAPVRMRVDAKTITLINGKDTQSWGNVAIPTSYFGPDYKGISSVAIPDFDGTQPFQVYFNYEEKKGVTFVDIYAEMKGKLNPMVEKTQAAAKQLATRFPVNRTPLKRCAP